MRSECSPSRRRYWLAALFLGVMFGFAAYRHSSFAVWNDSSALYHPHDSDDEIGSDQLGDQFRQSPFATLWDQCLRRSFLSITEDGYRPLSALWGLLSAALFFTTSYLPFPLLLAVGGVLGALAVSVFYVARRFVRHDLTALGAVLLVLGSPPLVGSSWVCVAGVQCLVPLFFCLSLLFYWNYVEHRYRFLSAAGLVLLLLLGPWVREFFGLNALLLIFLELRRTKRPTWIMGAAGLGFVHALFPTALVHWLFLPQVPLLPIYKLGSLSAEMGRGYLRWHAAWHFIPLLPPSLWVFAGLEALLRLRIRGIDGEAARNDRARRIENVMQALVLPCWLVIVLTLSILKPHYHDYLGLAITLVIAVLGMSRDLFLGFWFLLMYLPILRVFTEHIHFLYAVLPAAIILAGAMESLWLRLCGWPVLTWMRIPLACVFAVIGVDQALNIYGAYRVNRSIYGGIDVVADWFVRHVPARSAVVTNVLHGAEIKWHSDNRIDVYFTLTAGLPTLRMRQCRAVDQPAKLEELLARADTPRVYLLDVDFDYTLDKISNHRHKYVHQSVIDWRDLGVIHFSHTRFPFVDPLRYLIRREYQPFLGAPDLENDFARKCSVDHSFRHEVYAIYHVYEVAGRRLTANQHETPSLLQSELHGFAGTVSPTNGKSRETLSGACSKRYWE